MRKSSAVSADGVAQVVGRAVKTMRHRAGLTLAEVARRAEVTQSFLSQVENGRSMPSLLTLHFIAEALGVSAHTLLEGEDAQAVSLVRASEGTSYERSDVPGAAVERFLTHGRPGLEAGEVRATPGSDSGEHVGHQGEELVYVLEGTIEVQLEGRDPVQLAAGDALSYPGTIPHRWQVTSKQQARFLVIATPASF